jgi:hypothetical protein
MTAIAIVRQRSAIHVLSDGAFCDSDTGIVKFIGSKQWYSLDVPCVIVARGQPLYCALVCSNMLVAAPQFDEFKPHLLEHLKHRRQSWEAMAAKGASAAELEHVRQFEISVVGFSQKRDAFETWFVAGHDGYGGDDGPAAWEPVNQTEPMRAGPIPSAEAMASLGWELPDVDDFEPVEDGRMLLEAQRRTLVQLYGTQREEPLCFVGGFAQLTTLTSDSITSRIIGRWPDKVGEPLDRSLRLQ